MNICLHEELLDEVRRSRRLPPPPMRREIRKAANLSQARLAQELRVHRVSVARWEAGTRTPKGEMRVAYADLLDELQRMVLS